MLLAFKDAGEEESASCPSPEEVRAELVDYHSALVARLGPQPEEKGKCCLKGSKRKAVSVLCIGYFCCHYFLFFVYVIYVLISRVFLIVTRFTRSYGFSNGIVFFFLHEVLKCCRLLVIWVFRIDQLTYFS